MHKNLAIRIINWTLGVMVLGVPLLFVTRLMYPFILPKTALFQACAEIVIFLWIGLSAFYPEYRPRKNLATGAILFYLGALTLTALTGADVLVSFWSTAARGLGLVALWHFGLLAIALSSLGEVVQWKKLFLLGFGAALFSSITAILSGFGSYESGGNAIAKFFVTGDPSRPGSTFNNPTFLAGYLIFTLFLALWFAAQKTESSRVRNFAALTALFAFLGVLRTQTRGDVVGMLVGLAFFAVWFLVPKIFRKIPAGKQRVLWVGGFFLTSILVLSVSFPLWSQIPGLSRLASGSLIKEGLATRVIAWNIAWKGISERPLLGWGLENFNVPFSKHYDPRLLTSVFSETFWDKPHNVYLEYLIAGGALGLFGYLFLLFAFGYLAFRKGGDVAGAMLSLLLAYMIRSGAVFDTIGSFLMLFLLIAWLSRNASLRHEAHHSSSSPVLLGVFILSLVLVYFVNVRAVVAGRIEYFATADYVLGNVSASDKAFREVLSMNMPYRDATVANFLSSVKQSQDKGIPYPDIASLQKELIEEMEGIIARHPHHYYNYVLLAEFKNRFAFLDKNYLKDAEALLHTAEQLSPRRQQIYYILARTKLLQGDSDAAYALFEKTIALNPLAGDPHFYYGIMAYERGDATKGKEEIATAKRLGRSVVAADEAIALGTLAGDVGHDYVLASSYFEEGIPLATTAQQRLQLYLKLGVSYYLGGEPEKSKQAFERLIEGGVSLRSLPIFEVLKPALDELGVIY